MIATGRLTQQIAIEEPTATQDAYGAVTHSWAKKCYCWAAIETPSGREAILSGQPQGVLSHVVRIRYKSDITPKMRVKWGTRVLNIGSAIDPNQRHEELQLVCTEVL